LKKLPFAILLLGCSFCFRLLAVCSIGDRSLENEFATISHHILAGHGYAYFIVNAQNHVTEGFDPNEKPPQKALASAYMPPVYPLWVTFWVWLVGWNAGVWAIELTQAILGAWTCWLVWKVGVLCFDERTAKVAAWLYALHPLAVFSPSQISAVTVYTWLNMMALWMLLEAKKQAQIAQKRRYYIGSGFFYALLLLSRSESLLLLPFVGAWMLWEKIGWRNVAFWALPILALGSAWTLRNYNAFHEWTFNTSGGFNLWIGQHTGALGTHISYMPSGNSILPAHLHDAYQNLPHSAQFEVERDRLFRHEALQFMRQHPAEVALLALKKASFYWGHLWDARIQYPKARSAILLLSWYPFLACFIGGLWILRNKGRKYSLFYLYFGLSTAVVMLFFVLPRYILFLLPLMTYFAAYFMLREVTKSGRCA
jgi:hypothetical protein